MKLSKSVYLLLVIGLLGALLAPPVTAQGTDIPFTGLIQSVDGALLRVNGLIVDVSGVTLETTLEAGMTVTVTGQLQEDGSVVAQSLIVVTAPPAGTEGDGSEGALPVSGGGDICPLGQGFWKNHAEAWPVQELTLGSQTYSQEELLDLLRMPVGGDASLSLAHQLIAAKLSIAYGTDDSLIESFISGADEALAGFEGKLPYGVAPSSDDGQTMVTLAQELDRYNSGYLTPDCDVDMMPGLIVIQGPVTAINVNIITIYNINIEVNADDPMLTVLQIGDVIRVQGDVEDRDGLIVIVAINITFINIEVYMQGEDVWRDNGNCSNPPPPWAPANGWRRRCDSNNGGSGSHS